MSANSRQDEMVQKSFRMPKSLVARLSEAAVSLSTDASHLLRMILAEKLREYEERGRVAREGK